MENKLVEIAMKNTNDFLMEQSGYPKDFFENIIVVPLFVATDIITDMADQIKILMETNEKLRHSIK